MGACLEIKDLKQHEIYSALDQLGNSQKRIGRALARRILENGTLILYDVSSSYVEGTKCPLAEFGYNRDRKRGKKQVVYGLLCNKDGCPIAIEVFAGNRKDVTIVEAQI